MSWISIPLYAEPGQTHAFADREDLIASLYKALVEAGNAVRRGQTGVHHKRVVYGYKGVGKSSLILQTLGMLRGDLALGGKGQRTQPTDSLPKPLDPQRWLIIRVSGKNIGSMSAMVDTFRKAIDQDADSSEEPSSEPMLSFLQDVADTANYQAPGLLNLPILHRLFRKDEVKLYSNVRLTLSTLSKTIDYVRFWYDSVQSDKQEVLLSSEKADEKDAHIKAALKAHIKSSDTAEAEAALSAAAEVIRKSGETIKTTSQLERSWHVNAMQVVNPLNDFFRATNRARLPTILVLDDFDEFVSSVGPSVVERDRVLRWILGPFSGLRPTCLILGLRQEYMHEDIERRYTPTYVPPMTCECAIRALEAWVDVQNPALSEGEAALISKLGRRILELFDGMKESMVVPLQFLKMITWLVHQGVDPSAGPANMLDRYLVGNLYPDTARALEHIASAMPDDDVRYCLSCQPLDPLPYSISDNQRQALEKAGLLRPALAGDERNKLVVIDSLAAYMRAASRLSLAP